MRVAIAFLTVVGLATTLPVAQTKAARTTLDVYLIDVEGGGSTLFVSPTGQSLLVDAGNGGGGRGPIAVRDAERIMAAVKDAGLQQIDYLITTHWHGDHYGGMAELASRIPIKNFVDHGPNTQPNPATDEFLAKVYSEIIARGKHIVAKPGDVIPITGLDWRIVSAAGETIKTSLKGPGAGKPNPYCADFKPMEADNGIENAMSVGSVVTFGSFRVAHLGDLTRNKEFNLMCPMNRVGTVDLWVVSHHGQIVSNSEVLAHALQARVQLLNNGTRKGGQPETMKALHSAPRLEDLWQLHFSQLSGQEYTVPGMYIANDTDDHPLDLPRTALDPPPAGRGTPPPPPHNGPAYYIKVSAQRDGTFTVTNTRNGFSKTYGSLIRSAAN
ncbi:MAG TPA: MBL fold metallo-hydrolase [Planctomycetaceae bacterium]|jgi:beta-lactamase superfamily II metal-dependent hydrolase|nr:MBL fold metallo-hydrolase [Planctomycetaceae bacterium]